MSTNPPISIGVNIFKNVSDLYFFMLIQQMIAASGAWLFVFTWIAHYFRAIFIFDQSPRCKRCNRLNPNGETFYDTKKETRTNLAMKFLDVPRQRLGRFVHVVAEAAHQLHRVAGGRERAEAAAAQRVRRWVCQTEQVLDLQFGFYATQVVNPVFNILLNISLPVVLLTALLLKLLLL
uniref:(northern house mosquito) hypothetical protein n=1 Tax=Culex pipiens TaxID=7175 RepID=A0A8D8BMI0_CULPI